MKPFFSEKNTSNKHITLIEGEDIISNDMKVAEIMNTFFATSATNLDIREYNTISILEPNQNTISNIVSMLFFFGGGVMHFCPETITTHAESINSDLQRGLDRRLQHIQHWTQNRTS